jgi:hypothetical protein
MNLNIQEFVNLLTGEAIILDGDTSEYSIRKNIDIQKQSEGFKKYLSKGKQNPFYWGDMVNVESLLEQNKITLTIFGGILLLSCYVNHDSTLICKADRLKTPYTRNEIKEILGMKETTFKNFLSQSIKVGLLIVDKSGRNSVFRLNNEYHFIGKVKEKQKCKEMVRVYKEGILSMYNSGLTLNYIGFVYLILPYVDYTSCTLVNEPFAENQRPLTYKELGVKLNFTRATLRKYLEMTFVHNFGNGKVKDNYRLRVFGKFEAGKTVYCVNPIILRRCATQIGIIEYSQLDDVFKVAGTKFNDISM